MSGLDEKGLEAARGLASRLCIHSSDEERIAIIAATLRAQIASIRDETLEEAAKVADQSADECDWTDGVIEARSIAAAIRALQTKEQSNG